MDKHEGGIYFTPEFVNSRIADLPSYDSRQNNDKTIMIVRNLDISEGMCNGTRCY